MTKDFCLKYFNHKLFYKGQPEHSCNELQTICR